MSLSDKETVNFLWGFAQAHTDGFTIGLDTNFPYVRDTDANLLFKQSVKSKDDYMEGYKLYRKILAAQPDSSVKICSVGFLTTLSRLLQSGPDEFSPLTGVELFAKKVTDLYAMGGVFGEAVEPDYNFTQAIDYSLKFFELLPKSVNVVFSPGEVGDPLNYKPEVVLQDISWTDVHPIKWIYKFTQCDTGQKMWDPLAVINAVEGDAERNDTILKYIRLMNIQH